MFARIIPLTPAFVILFALTGLMNSSLASPEAQQPAWRASPELVREHLRVRVDGLHKRLEIQPAQQAAWDDFAAAVKALSERAGQRPAPDADAAALIRFRADRAADLSRRLNAIADATARLEATLTEDKRKLLDQEVRNFHGQRHAPEAGRE